MSYTKIDIKGHEVGLKFGYECNKWFFTAMIENLDTYTDEVENLSTLGFAKLFHCAYRNNCIIKEVETTLKTADFYDWLEESLVTEEGKTKFASIVNIWAETQNTKDIVAKMQALREPDEEKKIPVLTT